MTAQDFVVRKATTADARWIIERHAALYARDEGFDESFGRLVDQIVTDFFTAHDPRSERAWIAQTDQRLGCIFCVRLDDKTAKLRLFLLEPEARGLGLGRRLLDTCLGFAKDAGYRRISLWTHESHHAACRLYAANGFNCVASRPVRSFGRDLLEQNWVRDI